MAADFVRRAIVAERDRGAAVLLVSADLDEVLAISDRVAVMYEGRFVGTVNPATTSLAEVGLLMAGIHPGTATKRSDAGVEIDPVDLL
jgi:simple sugar transport system ATP-binding protein